MRRLTFNILNGCNYLSPRVVHNFSTTNQQKTKSQYRIFSRLSAGDFRLENIEMKKKRVGRNNHEE